jgi:hypothetical protein
VTTTRNGPPGSGPTEPHYPQPRHSVDAEVPAHNGDLDGEADIARYRACARFGEPVS